MAASKLPPEVVEVIEAREGRWTTHAIDQRDDLGLTWADVIAVARSSDWWKREADDDGLPAIDGKKDSTRGRDTCGRRIYMTGKRVYYDQEEVWNVVTIKKDRAKREQQPKRRRERR